jgi:hypothetical protein
VIRNDLEDTRSRSIQRGRELCGTGRAQQGGSLIIFRFMFRCAASGPWQPFLVVLIVPYIVQVRSHISSKQMLCRVSLQSRRSTGQGASLKSLHDHGLAARYTVSFYIARSVRALLLSRTWRRRPIMRTQSNPSDGAFPRGCVSNCADMIPPPRLFDQSTHFTCGLVARIFHGYERSPAVCAQWQDGEADQRSPRHTFPRRASLPHMGALPRAAANMLWCFSSA